jgi:hypothetical protein
MTARANEPNLRGRWNMEPDAHPEVEARLRSAIAIYETVVRQHPDFVEARLRFAWTEFLDNSNSHARSELEACLAQSQRTDIKYLAHMFLGAVDERENHVEEAARHYEAAHAIDARQSSVVALIRIEHVRGNISRMEELAADLGLAAHAADEDPWRLYAGGITSGELLEWLRREARTP